MIDIITEETYFSKENETKYMGVSQFKAFEACPFSALAKIGGEFESEPGTALLVGSYVDAHFSSSLDIFKAHHPEIFKRDGSLKSDYEQANYIIERIERQPLMMKLLSGKTQKIMTGSIAGVDVKIKVDSLLPDAITDLKIMRDFADIYVEEKGRLPWYEAWEYDLQGAVYQEIVRQNTGEKLPFILCAATKEKEPDVKLLQIPQTILDYELNHFAENAPMFDAVKKGILEPERCEKCDYCKKTKILTEIEIAGGSEDE